MFRMLLRCSWLVSLYFCYVFASFDLFMLVVWLSIACIADLVCFRSDGSLDFDLSYGRRLGKPW